MVYILAAVVSAWLLFTAYGLESCTGESDGNYEIGCKVYVSCFNGVLTTHECPVGYVYNSIAKGCDLANNVGPPCGLSIDCSGRNDGRYANVNLNCTAYYTCHGGLYFGHNYCAGGLVFDNIEENCVWPYQAYPPCGDKTALI